jgi:preprotein translocase subunit SecE
MSHRRILGFCYVAASVLLFLIMNRFMDWLIATVRIENIALGPLTFTSVAALVITVAAVFGTWNYPKVHTFLMEVIDEVSKVVWPTRQETRDSTMVVIVFVFVIASILGSFDLVWAKLTNLILSSSVN